ncbi:PREDICTED: uncharacterized protein LOC105960316 [Erythranthe guttata]|uniref:uncharacterized protein LOC105960316 n=1 Tax=Erythranthe guttata TaxID=4155 RepID=UPI00064DD7DE|nr:PREDICTED: uncharacterized protein LOC105960316 [Erythranthe guttata]|eukprot:XP_012839934.1 PREDICTED: uncharacterized protein LOC105960316 [Erythranthe guttata]
MTVVECSILYGHGGTSKTILWLTLSAAVRSKGEIVINVPSSGIASLLLSSGRTTHSRFGLPINVHESFTCSISQQSPHAELLIRAKLIIWDEAPMMRRDCFEVLDKTMKSILQVGNEDDGEQNDGEASIEISDDMLIGDSDDPFRDLLEFIYPDLLSNMYDPNYFHGRAILAPTNEFVESVNDHLMSLLPGGEKVYLSSDSMCRDEQTMKDNAEIYSTEFLNTIRCSGLCSHALKFKVGAPVMLIRNIDQARGLCNGTRLQIIKTGFWIAVGRPPPASGLVAHRERATQGRNKPRSPRFQFQQKSMAIHKILRRSLSAEKRTTEVPNEHLAVYVGESENKRFVIPLSYLNDPLFQELLYQTEEELGFHLPMGGLTIPCSEDLFIDLTSQLSKTLYID